MSFFNSVRNAAQAMRAHQLSIQVTGENINNVGKKGATRQIADLANSSSGEINISGRTQFVGGNVQVKGIREAVDPFMEKRLEEAIAKNAGLEESTKQFQSIEKILNETTSKGIVHAMDRFYNAWSGLNSNPTENAKKLEVKDSAVVLTERIRTTYQSLQSRNTEVVKDLIPVFDEIDSIALRIANLNKDILSLGPESNPNSMLQERRELVRALSQLTDISTFTTDQNAINISIGNYTLVQETNATSIPRTYDAATQTLTDGTSNFSITGGKLHGQLKGMDTLKNLTDQLDLLANTLKTEINNLHATGLNASGTTHVLFFDDVPTTVPATPQTGAIDFDISPAIKGDYRLIMAGTGGNTGDSDLAKLLSEQRDSQYIALGGQTAKGFYDSLVVGHGLATKKFGQYLSDHKGVLKQTWAQRESTSGPSYEEEASNLVQQLRALQASGKYFSVADEAILTVINMVRT